MKSIILLAAILIPAVVSATEVEKEVVFNATVEELVEMFKENREYLMKDSREEILKKEDGKVWVKVTLPGKDAYVTVSQSAGFNPVSGEGYFESHLIETDGHVLKQKTLIKIYRKGNKSAIKIKIEAEVKGISNTVMWWNIHSRINSVMKKAKSLNKSSNRKRKRFRR